MLPDVFIINASDVIWDVKTEGSLGCTDYTLGEFVALRDMGDVRTEIRPLNFGKLTFSTSGRLSVTFPGRLHLGTGELGHCYEQSWKITKEIFHKA